MALRLDGRKRARFPLAKTILQRIRAVRREPLPHSRRHHIPVALVGRALLTHGAPIPILRFLRLIIPGVYSGSEPPLQVVPLHATDDLVVAREDAGRQYTHSTSSGTCSTSSGQVSTCTYTRDLALIPGRSIHRSARIRAADAVEMGGSRARPLARPSRVRHSEHAEVSVDCQLER